MVTKSSAPSRGNWTLEAVTMLSHRLWAPLRTDLKNAGAEWVDQEVTSRMPYDIPAFKPQVIKLLANGRGQG